MQSLLDTVYPEGSTESNIGQGDKAWMHCLSLCHTKPRRRSTSR